MNVRIQLKEVLYFELSQKRFIAFSVYGTDDNWRIKFLVDKNRTRNVNR